MAERTIMVAYGTQTGGGEGRPAGPTLRRSAEFSPLVAVTGQHREMLDQVNDVFGIVPDVDLDIFEPGQSLGQVTTRTIAGVERVLAERRPDAVVVQGDTTTTLRGRAGRVLRPDPASCTSRPACAPTTRPRRSRRRSTAG